MKELLASVEAGALSVNEALARLGDLPYEDLGYAALDHHRTLRTGFPKVVFGQGKTPEQIAAIAERLAANSDRLLVTDASVRFRFGLLFDRTFPLRMRRTEERLNVIPSRSASSSEKCWSLQPA